MTNITTGHRGNRDLHWQLLATVSAVALLASVYGIGEAEAADSDRPLMWLELGGQLSYLGDTQESFAPPFAAAFAQGGMSHAVDVQSPPRSALDAEGKLSFQPGGSDWIFSASIQFGRSKTTRYHHQQTVNPYAGPANFDFYFYGSHYVPAGTKYPDKHVRFADARANESERHLIVDFQAGKDVGLGMFGDRGSSVVSAGVRFAQFDAKGTVNLKGVPDLQYPNVGPMTSFTAFQEFKYSPVAFHNYSGMLDYKRSFRGLGPSLEWSGSRPFAGDEHSGELSVDLGVNAALLFGRQRASGHRQTNAISYRGDRWHFGHARNGQGAEQSNPHIVSGYFVSSDGNPHYNSGNFNRVRSVAIPNLGATAGFSYRIEDFKVSLGYRADFFFGATDGGIDTRKTENRGFFGPFASISVGLGD